jgi:phospholipid/cholesterol/gamma-HCH transport system substrate-binding protein
VIKETPSFGRILAMVGFAGSCVGILLFLWLSFGGSLPLRPHAYRFQVAVPEATTLAVESDVRISGVTVGKVTKKRLDRGGDRTLLDVEIQPRYAPLPKDTRAILRQKTLLGETFLELSPGHKSSGLLADNSRLPDAHVQPTVQLDEIFGVFDPRTRRAFQRSSAEFAKAFAGNHAQELNDSIGNLEDTATAGDRLFTVLDDQRGDLRRFVHNGSVVFGALNDRQGALRGLITNANDTFGALASRDRALAQTIAILPTFLHESRATLRRVARFTDNSAPVVRGLQPVADDLRPTVRDLSGLSPDLRATFHSLGPLITRSRTGLPALTSTVKGARPLVAALNPFLAELNPILAMLEYNQVRLAGFISNGTPGINGNFGGHRYNNVVAMVDPRSFNSYTSRPPEDRGQAYLAPNFANRIIALGGFETTNCSNAVGPRDAYGDVARSDAIGAPPLLKTTQLAPSCLVAGKSLYDGSIVPSAAKGRTALKPPDRGTQGSLPLTGRP